jgi:hypothetical protein
VSDVISAVLYIAISVVLVGGAFAFFGSDIAMIMFKVAALLAASIILTTALLVVIVAIYLERKK